jgi:hypothetical protein
MATAERIPLDRPFPNINPVIASPSCAARAFAKIFQALLPAVTRDATRAISGFEAATAKLDTRPCPCPAPTSANHPLQSDTNMTLDTNQYVSTAARRVRERQLSTRNNQRTP